MAAQAQINELILEGDTRNHSRQTVTDYLDLWAGEDTVRKATAAAMIAILDGAPILGARLAKGGLPGDPGKPAGSNADGDTQKRIDIGAHLLFIGLLQAVGVASILSEEADLPIDGNPTGKVVVAIDPLDGSGNVGTGAPLGTIFSILPFAGESGGDPFLRPGREQIAAGFVSYGHTIDLGFSVGDGVILATLSPGTGHFHIVSGPVRLGAETSDLAYNASVYRHLQPAMRTYVEDCLAGKDGPRAKNFNMRWLGSLVGEVNRIFVRNGLFFYVDDRRPGYEQGRLRLIYEANPVAFLCEQAGAKATDGRQAILDKIPSAYHQRSPLVFGAAAEVDTVCAYLRGHNS